MKPHFHSYICRRRVYKGIFDVNVMELSLVRSYSRIYSTKSPSSVAVNVREPRLSQVGECAKSCARSTVCLCSQSGEGASIGLLT
jgi:hypothetical protein